MEHHEERAEAAAEEMEDGAREMEARAEKLDEELDETRGEWRRKQQDPQVPGAQATEDDADDAD
jgi:hypothetical protein